MEFQKINAYIICLAIPFLAVKLQESKSNSSTLLLYENWKRVSDKSTPLIHFGKISYLKLNHKYMESLEKVVYQELLPFVNKPGRYQGNEINIIRKNWNEMQVTFALIFPELYELGMSYLGFDILYHILNREKDICAERVFAPDEDLEKLLRERQVPLFSLETKMPLKAFDILGITFQYELHVTNIINLLDLGQIPLLAGERKEADPLVVLGGPCAFNPEPIADFVDAVVLGDGEEMVLELAACIRQAKAKNYTRDEKLKSLAQLPGVYVPQFYQVRYQPGGAIAAIEPITPGLPVQIEARITPALAESNYPPQPIVPLIPITHDRFSLEIMRGCTRGCRFCNAGMIYRPVRERSVEDLVAYAKTVIQNTGYNELSLVSLSSSDYSHLQELISQLAAFTTRKNVRLSFPSLRPETFSSEIAALAAEIKKSGLTLAPEAGTERLRKVINKTNSNSDLLQAVTIAFQNGWQLIKLYFMIGQPTETPEDLQGIADLMQEVIQLAQRFGGRRINVSISPFIPKAHTPFQWESQNSMPEIDTKVHSILQRLRYRHLNVSWRDPAVALVEGVIARGDRRLGAAILNAWRLGAKFDAWTHGFKFDIWQKAFEMAGITPDFYTRARSQEERLPWYHLSTGVTVAYLKQEAQRAYQAETTADCRQEQCQACGLMPQPGCQPKARAQRKRPEAAGGRTVTPAELKSPAVAPGNPVEKARLIRLKFAKQHALRFISHLDLMRLFERVFHRAGIPLAYSQGFHPHPKIAFGPPLALGLVSESEYVDVQYQDLSVPEFMTRLQSALPPGLVILASKPLYGKGQSLCALVNRIDYEITFPANFEFSPIQTAIQRFNATSEFRVIRQRENLMQSVDIAPFILNFNLNPTPATLVVITRLENGKTVRVDEILSNVLGLTPQQAANCLVKRQEMYIEFGDVRRTPMEI